MFSVQLLARFFSNSDKLIVPAQQTLLRVDLATNMFKYRDCDDDVFQWVMGFFHHFVSSVRSSYSHPDLLLIHHHHPTFSDHTGPQHWTFTF